MKVLSLFDGMACGMIAMQAAGIEVDRYVAYEIDKYAVHTSSHNFPMIEHRGDVFEADFSEFVGFDWLIGGSPCTYWSIAQKNNRETEASGIGWELFCQYVRALNEAKPRFFIYENNKSMSSAIRESITKEFGFDPVLINSALVSAQNRQRLYWVGRRNADGTYSKVDVKQPVDRGILLKDILDSGCDLTSKDKSYTLTASYNGACSWNTIERNQRTMIAEPVATDKDGKAFCLTANYAGAHIPHSLEKSVRSMCAEPVNITADGKSQTIKAQSAKTSIANICCYSSTYGASGVAEPVCLRYERSEEAKLCRKAYEAHEIYHGYNELNELHPRPDGKTNTLTTVLKDNQICIPVAFDGNIPTKAISRADGKTYQVYEVENGLITIKNKQYPIKLADGYYIIRKLTVSECKRLQTVPEWYEFPVSDSQAYKMLGNGWTVDVIVHLIKSIF